MSRHSSRLAKRHMAETNTDPRRTAVRQGWFSRALATVSQAIMWLLFSLLFSIIVEWTGMVLWWQEQGLDHSRTMLAQEISYLDSDFRRSVVASNPARFAKAVADGSYHYLFEVTKVIAVIHWLTPPPQPQEQGVRPTLHTIYRPVAEFVIAAMQVTQLFSVRLAILMLATPVFLLFSLVALVDGLVKRDLRRWGGGRESSFIYHYAKKAALPLVVLSWVIYLALPFSLHPTFVLLPFATLFALSVRITASTFKKYL